MIPLTILVPSGIAYSFEVESFTVPTDKGPLMIEGGYTPTIVNCLPAGVLKVVEKGKNKYFALFSGILHVKNNRAVLLAENIESGSDIDLDRATKRRDEKEEVLNSKTKGQDLILAKASLLKQLTRIKVKNLTQGAAE